ncbi:MAG: DUF4215 domain-containing protein [Proteobacteria bacterium]|nr:DUF4215 domain-containing protein [Pseudomonadota bacterium]
MSRSPFLLPLHLLLLLLLVGCPDDDDDSVDPGDDDDATADPCAGFDDLTATVGTGTVTLGDTTPETDDYAGSCSNAEVPESVFVFTAPEDGTYLVTTNLDETEYDTLLFAFTDCADSLASELACNDDIILGEVFASELVFDAADGDVVYVAVEGYDNVGQFGITIELVVCGDGIVTTGELCDDGNTEAGDGCDADCIWECDLEDAQEDDDTIATATPLTLPAAIGGFLCTTDISPDFDPVYLDLFEVTITDEGAYLDASVGPGGVLTTDCTEQTLSLLVMNDDTNNEGADNTGDGECARVVEELDPGTYYIAVHEDDSSIPPQDYELTVSTGVSVCGDGTTEGVEECDDGANEPDDGCTPGCLLEEECPVEDGDLSPLVDAESLSGATVEGDASLHEPSCGSDGSPEVAFVFTAFVTGPVVFTTNNPGTDFDTTLYVRSSCADADTEITCDDDIDGENRTSIIGLDAVEGVAYTVIVDGWGGSFGNFELTAYTPVCGDGELDPTEECDDGNDVALDGCEDDCQVTPACDYAADIDLGLLDGPTAASVETVGDDVTAATCSAEGGGDALIRFQVGTAGSVSFDVSLADGVDAQFQLWGPDDVCPTVGDCYDPYPDPTGTFEAELGIGVYYLVVDAWNEEFEGAVDVTITAP